MPKQKSIGASYEPIDSLIQIIPLLFATVMIIGAIKEASKLPEAIQFTANEMLASREASEKILIEAIERWK